MQAHMFAMRLRSVKGRLADRTVDMYAIVLHMKRMQVQFTDEQARALQERASGTRRPIAAVVRDAVEAWIATDQRHMRHARAVAAIGGFHSGLGDLAERHDDYLDRM
ncbi:MAG: hypothetical protein AB1736_05585 [Chloroflexota bacterium]